MNKYYFVFLSLFLFLAVGLLVLSIIRIMNGNVMGDARKIGFFLGAIVWEDLFVFSLLWIVIAIILFFLNRPIFFPIAYLSFWIVRSVGETIYWFNQQFHPETVPWPEWFPKILFLQNLTQHQWWVLMQIFWQSITTLCILGLVYTLYLLFKS